MEAPSVSSLKHLHCYWTHPNEDTEDHCPGDIKESMKSRSIPFVGKFQEIKWACRAPLPSGKLCPRKDRYVTCTNIHGKNLHLVAMLLSKVCTFACCSHCLKLATTSFRIVKPLN